MLLRHSDHGSRKYEPASLRRLLWLGQQRLPGLGRGHPAGLLSREFLPLLQHSADACHVTYGSELPR